MTSWKRTRLALLSLSAVQVSAAGFSLLQVGRVPLRAGEATFRGDLATEPVCGGTNAKIQRTGDEANLVLSMPDGTVLTGNGGGGIVISQAGRRVGTLHMPPQLKSSYLMGRLGVVAHTGRIEQMTLLDDGRTLLTLGNDNTARVWDIPTRRMLRLHVAAGQVCALREGVLLETWGPPSLTLWAEPEGRRLWRNIPPGIVSLTQIVQVDAHAVRTLNQVVRLSDGQTLGFVRAGEVAFSPDNSTLALYTPYPYTDANLAELFSVSGKLLGSVPNRFSSSGLNNVRSTDVSLDVAFSPDAKTFSVTRTVLGHMIIETVLGSRQTQVFRLKEGSACLLSSRGTEECSGNSVTPKTPLIGYFSIFDGKRLSYFDTATGHIVAPPTNYRPESTFSSELRDENGVWSLFGFNGQAGLDNRFDLRLRQVKTAPSGLYVDLNDKTVPLLDYARLFGQQRVNAHVTALAGNFMVILLSYAERTPEGFYISDGERLEPLLPPKATIYGFLNPLTLLVTSPEGVLQTLSLRSDPHATATAVKGIPAHSDLTHLSLSPDHSHLALLVGDEYRIYRLQQTN